MLVSEENYLSALKNRIKIVSSYEKYMEFIKWSVEIPYIQFPATWRIRIIPPFGGAIVRFRVLCGNADISVYLDCYDRLGFYKGKPYWEVYPHQEDIFRCDMEDVAGLLSAIKESIEEKSKSQKKTLKLKNL